MMKNLLSSNICRIFSKFLIVGGATFLSDSAMTQILISYAHLSFFHARLISMSILVVVTWIVNRYFTFKPQNKRSLKEFLLYIFVTIIGFIINLSVYTLMVHLFPQIVSFIILAILPATGCSFLFTFFFLYLVVFK